VKFEGTSLKVIISDKTEAQFAISDIIRFTYVNRDPTGIDDLVADDDPTAFDYREGVLVVSQLKENAVVGIYALDGKLVKQLRATHAGTYRLSLSALPKGVYIVKADAVTYKIMKR
jgi:hypothetical protein